MTGEMWKRSKISHRHQTQSKPVPTDADREDDALGMMMQMQLTSATGELADEHLSKRREK
jgi:hypothetical protein